MKPKAALVKNGTLPPGSENKRGRISREHNAILEGLAAKGWNIEGYSVSKSTDSTTAPTVTKVSVDPNRIADVPDEARSESLWSAFVDGKEVGMRTVDNRCGSSLTYCHCEKPMVWIDHERQGMVNFKPRTVTRKA